MTERKHATNGTAEEPRASALKQAVRKARIEVAERTSVVVDLRDAAAARLEILNEALDPVFADIPADIDLFDRGITRGDPPRLWVDMIAHVAMARDRRVYRLLQDTRNGRRVLAESADVQEMVKAVTDYLARRLVERERALADGSAPGRGEARFFARRRRAQRWRMLVLFVLGMLIGAAALLAIAWIRVMHVY